jgi:hypothetical protein
VKWSEPLFVLSLLFGNFVKERGGSDNASIERSECRERNWTLILSPFNLLGSMMIEIKILVEIFNFFILP